MAITVQDEPLEEKIRRLSRQRGMDPVTVIAQAIDAFAAAPVPKVDDRTRVDHLPPEEVARRMAALDAVQKRIAERITEAERAAMQAIEADMYDEHGLPK